MTMAELSLSADTIMSKSYDFAIITIDFLVPKMWNVMMDFSHR